MQSDALAEVEGLVVESLPIPSDCQLLDHSQS